MEHTKENYPYITKEGIHQALDAMLVREVNRLNTADTPDELHQSTRRWMGALELVELLDPTIETGAYDRDHGQAFARNWTRIE